MNESLKQMFNPKGRFRIEHYRKKQLIGVYEFPNGITNVGKNNILGVYFKEVAQTPEADWCVGLISAAGFDSVNAADTMASHSGWSEFTDYSQSSRPAWGQGAVSAQSITNSVPVQFDVTGTGSITGIFIVNDDAKSGTDGILWTTALYSPVVPVVDGDELRVTYALGT